MLCKQTLVVSLAPLGIRKALIHFLYGICDALRFVMVGIFLMQERRELYDAVGGSVMHPLRNIGVGRGYTGRAVVVQRSLNAEPLSHMFRVQALAIPIAVRPVLMPVAMLFWVERASHAVHLPAGAPNCQVCLTSAHFSASRVRETPFHRSSSHPSSVHHPICCPVPPPRAGSRFWRSLRNSLFRHAPL